MAESREFQNVDSGPAAVEEGRVNTVHLDQNTPEQLRTLKKQLEDYIAECYKSLSWTTPIASQFEGKDEAEMTAEEIELWNKNRPNYNNAKRFLQQCTSDLSEVTRILELKEKQQQSSKAPAAKSTTPAKSIVSRKTGRSTKSAVKQVEVECEEKAMKVRHELEDKIDEMDSEIETLQEVLSATPAPEKPDELRARITELKIKVSQLKKKRDREVERCKEVTELEKKKLLIEEEESGDSSVEELSNPAVKWTEQHKDLFGTTVPDNFYYPQRNGQGKSRFPGVLKFKEGILPKETQLPQQEEATVPTEASGISELTKALKDVFREVRGDKEWKPKDLPTFNGKAEDWPIFKGEFDRTTPEGKVNTSQNAIRLRKALQGDARDAVVGLLHEPANVRRIMLMLEQNFGRKELIIDALIRKAEGVKSPDNHKPESFVTYGRVVQQLVETARAMKEERYLNDIGLLNKLVSKLPLTYAREWKKWITMRISRTENLESFGDWIDDQMRVMVQLVTPTVKEESTGSTHRKGKRGPGQVCAAVEDDKEEKACAHCDKTNHKIQKCFSFKKLPLEERVQIVKEKGLCFRCLDKGHSKSECSSDVVCNVKDCKSQHHPLIHGASSWKGKPRGRKFQKADAAKPEEKKEAADNPGSEEGTSAATQGKSTKPYSIVRIKIRGPKGTRRVYALLDSGSNVTLLDSEFADDLGITGRKFQHRCRGVGGIRLKEESQEVEFEVAANFANAKFHKVTEAVTTKSVGLKSYTQDAEEIKRKWPYLKRAKLESFSNVKVGIIVGEDHPFLTAHREILERGEHEPMAKRTILGWVFGGKTVKAADSTTNVFQSMGMDSLEALIKESYTVDSFGIINSVNKGSLEDQRALDILEKTVKKNDDVWECGLLWRDENVKLTESRSEAMATLMSNEKRMQRDSVFKEMYHAKISEYIRKGYVTELTAAEVKVKTDKTKYIPHFGVFNVNKPGKLRLVFNAASKSEGTSLNDHLLSGPDLIRPLPAVLWNFRRHNYVIQGDIEDMFHRVAVRKDDRDAQRFLWRDQLTENGAAMKTYQMNVLIFGACSSPASAIYVKNRNAQDFLQEFPEAVRAITEDFYVDDCLSGAQTVEEAIRLRKEIFEVNAAGNFMTRKWLSNSKEVISSVPAEDRAVGIKDFGNKSEIPTERVLGLWWNAEEDCFTFKTNFKKLDPRIMQGERPTKREMCSLLMSVFDPLGFLSNFKIKGMILFQQVWRTGIHWDDEVTDPVYEEWRVWIENLKKVENLRIPRCYCWDIHLAKSVELHTMVDASEEACASASYLRVTIGDAVSLSFVAAKTKVAPNRKQTIPRLELMAAVIGVGMAHTICNELKVNINRRIFWSDSRTVLLWLRSETLRYREFVANKISRIHELSSVSEWRWVPTALNVADEGTRLKKEVSLASDSPWLLGPPFLLENDDKWPVEKKKEKVPEEDLELRTAVCAISSESCTEDDKSLVNIGRFSSFTRAVRVAGCVRAAYNFWKAKHPKFADKTLASPWALKNKAEMPRMEKDENSQKYAYRLRIWLRENAVSLLSPDNRVQGEMDLVREAQREAFPEDMKELGHGRLSKKSCLWKLSPYLEDGVIRMKGRIGAAKVSHEKKNPAILPSKGVLSQLIIMREHERNAHQGLSTVLNNLRERYWIIGGRAAIQLVVGKCKKCIFMKTRPMVTKMGDLPYYRLSSGQPPFTFTGVDYFGPLEVTVGRHHEKRWVALFTCMVTRAVHLEVVHGLSTDDFLMAFSRFVDQRGRVKYMYSDNGTNFVGARTELRKNWEAIDWSSIMESDKFQEVKWQFTPPCSPHFGGAWERLVQAVKKVLKVTLLEKFPRDQTLLTVLKGAENIVNSRPLTYVSEDAGDPEVLTPNHFLRGFCDVGPSIPGEYEPGDEVRRLQWRRAQLLLDRFWDRWTKEVLPDLAKRQKWHSDGDTLEVGSLVLLVDDLSPRNTWSRGVVVKTFPGEDGIVRVVEVKTPDLSSKEKGAFKIFKRGVRKLCPLGLTIGKSECPRIWGPECYEEA